MIVLARWLESHRAYRDVVEWAEPFGEDWGAAWRACPRGDWLLAIAATLETTDRRALARAAGACAALALEATGDPRARAALEALEAWCEGAPGARLEAAHAALEAALAETHDPTLQATRAAALSAIATPEHPREAPGAAAAAVQANVLATGECALDTVIRYVHATTAERVRAAIAAPAAPDAAPSRPHASQG